MSAPRVNDRRTDQDGARHRFTSRILPPYMRRSPKVAEVLPVLYLRGLSTGDFREALAALLGDDAAGLSATNIARLRGLLMAYKLLDMAQARWRRLDGAHLLPLVRAGIAFVDGVQQEGKGSKPKAKAA